MIDANEINADFIANIREALERAARLANASQWCDAADAASEAIRYIHRMPMSTSTQDWITPDHTANHETV